MFLEILILAALTLFNGALAMSELAVVSSRDARLRRMAEDGRPGAQAALTLKEDPGRFLSSVQIGITLVGILAGAVSGATLGARLAASLAASGLSPSLAQTLGVGGVVAVITYAQLILGELVPKQMALARPEEIAARVAPAMRLLARIATPIVWFLDLSGRLVLRLLGQRGGPETAFTDEEVTLAFDEAQNAGVLAPGEHEMLLGVMRVADRRASSLMTPRREVEVLDLSRPHAELIEQARLSPHARLPVRDGGEDDITGVIALRDLLALPPGAGIDTILRAAPVVMDQARAAQVIARLKEQNGRMLLVYDEFGHFEGIITAMDLLEGIAGRFSDDLDPDEGPAITEREDGSLLVAGWMPVDEFADRLRLARPRGDFDTAAGFVLDRMGRLPREGESFHADGWIFEVVDLDGARIDKILARREPVAEA